MDFPLPPVGEGLLEVELVRWLVQPGDAVVRGQGLAEVMSDKASMEVPSPFAGTITALAATPGTKVKVGETFLSYNPVAESVAVTSAATARAVSEEPTPPGPPSLKGGGENPRSGGTEPADDDECGVPDSPPP